MWPCADLCFASLTLTLQPATGLLTLTYGQRLFVVFYLSASGLVMVDTTIRDHLGLCPAGNSCDTDYCQLSPEQPVKVILEVRFDFIFTHSIATLNIGPTDCDQACWGDGTACAAGTSCNSCCNPYTWWEGKHAQHHASIS